MYDDTDPSRPLVRLIGGLSLQYDGRRMALPPGSHRLLAYLAVHSSGVDPRRTAEALWPSVDDGRAAGNLRSALWRLQQVGCPLVRAGDSTVALRDGVEVDLDRFRAWADRMLSGVAGSDDLAVDPATIVELELLPGWHDDWVLAVRDGLHLRRMQALDRLLLQRPAQPSTTTTVLQTPPPRAFERWSRRDRQATVSVRAPLAPLVPVARRAAAARIARALLCRSVNARYT